MSRIALFALVVFVLPALSAQDYKAEIKKMSAESRVRLSCHESDNFVWALASNMAQARPIIKTAEEAFQIWKKISGIASWKEMWGRKKCLVVVTNNKNQHRKVAKWWGDNHNTYGSFDARITGQRFYWPQPFPRCTIFMHAKPISMKHLRNVAAHEVGHMCMMRYQFHQRPIPPWLEESFGCYMEARTIRRTNCYCFSGGYGEAASASEKFADIQWSKWKEMVRHMASKRTDRPMRAILPHRMSQLSAPEVGKCWSVIEYLIQQDASKFCAFIGAMKKYWPKTYDPAWSKEKLAAQERALKESFDLTFDQLDDAWRKWAKAGMK